MKKRRKKKMKEGAQPNGNLRNNMELNLILMRIVGITGTNFQKLR